MGLTLESFRTGIRGAGAEQDFLVYSESGKGGLKLEPASQEVSQSGCTYNVFVRSKLLNLMRESLSASNRSGKAVDDFMAKAEKELFGPLGGDGRYGVDKASQRLECATVKSLLDEFDSKFGNPPKGSAGNGGPTGPLSNKDKKLLKAVARMSRRPVEKERLDQMLSWRHELAMNERQTGVFGELKSGIPDLKTVGIAPDGKSVLCKGNGPDGPVELLITPFGEVVENSSYEQSLANLDATPHMIAYDKSKLLRTFDPATVEQLSFLTSLVDSKYVSLLVNQQVNGALVNMMPRVMADVRKHEGLGANQQENLNALWRHLGFEGEAPKLDDQDLKKKFTKALAGRIAGDIVGEIKPGDKEKAALRDDIAKYIFSEDETEWRAVSERRGYEEFQNKIVSRNLDVLGKLNGISYPALVKCVQVPGSVPKTSDFYWKPSETAVSRKHLVRDKEKNVKAGDKKYGTVTCLHGVRDVMHLFTKSPLQKGGERYRNFRFTLEGKGLDVWDSEVPLSVRARDFEQAFKKFNYKDAQIVRAIRYLNDVLFDFKPNDFAADRETIHLNNHVSASRFGKGSGFAPTDMKLRIEIPTKDGGTLFHEVAVHEDGSYEMVEHGKVEGLKG